VLTGQVKDIHFRISVQTGYADSFCILSGNGAAEIPKYSPPITFEAHKININLLQKWGSHVTLVKEGTREE
jgi:hypothetical protein